MLRKLLDLQLSLFDKGKPLHKLRPFVSAADNFLYQPLHNTQRPPYIRDAVDVKRWMFLVVVALIPCMIWAIWNTGMQSFVYGSKNYSLLEEYFKNSHGISTYFYFAFQDGRWISIILLGLKAFLPVLIISYLVGGLWEGIFACIRGHEISEGFLVTGALFALILPSTIPYWMVALGVSVGIILSKELFGGTGMNILNPALTCRVFLYFSFPSKMTGDIWVGTNPTSINKSITSINEQGHLSEIDGITSASPLNSLNISDDIKRIHVDAIATNLTKENVPTYATIEKQFHTWVGNGHDVSYVQDLTQNQLQDFVTTPLVDGGLGLSIGEYPSAYQLTEVKYGLKNYTDWNFFFGNQIGSMGETSVLACLLGAIFLIYIGIGSFRTMIAMGLGAYICALIFEFFALYFGKDNGAWNIAKFAFPAYKQLLMGGLAFGLVFMATDPVSSPNRNLSKWIYGFFIGFIVIIIRLVNPGFPEGVMLAILLGNIFAPLIDYYVVRRYRSPV